MFKAIVSFILRYWTKDLSTILKIFDKAYHELEEFIEKTTAEAQAKEAAAKALITESDALVAEVNRASTVKANISNLIG